MQMVGFISIYLIKIKHGSEQLLTYLRKPVGPVQKIENQFVFFVYGRTGLLYQETCNTGARGELHCIFPGEFNCISAAWIRSSLIKLEIRGKSRFPSLDCQSQLFSLIVILLFWFEKSHFLHCGTRADFCRVLNSPGEELRDAASVLFLHPHPPWLMSTLAFPQPPVLQDLSLLTILFIYILVVYVHCFLKNKQFPTSRVWGKNNAINDSQHPLLEMKAMKSHSGIALLICLPHGAQDSLAAGPRPQCSTVVLRQRVCIVSSSLWG